MKELDFVDEPVDVNPEEAADGTLEPPLIEEASEPPDLDADELAAAAGAAGSHALRAVALALTQQGMRENPCGSNRNPYSAYFGYGPQFWCADFVGWSLDSTGNRDKKVPWGYPSAVRNITTWARGRGLIVPTPRRGDIFTYRNGAHTGLVAGVSGGAFTSIEGNTSGPDGRTCYVAQHKRAVSDGRYWYVRWPR
jgi:CHAP domain